MFCTKEETMDVSILAKKSALLLINMQNHSLSGAAAGRNASINCKRAAEYAHKNKIPVFYAKTVEREDMSDKVLWISDSNLSRNALYNEPAFFEGYPDAEIIKELSPEARDYIISKRRMSAFTGTDLNLLLRALNADTLLLGGISSLFEVEATAMAGRELDYNLVFLTDCIALKNNEIQEFMTEHVFPFIGRCMTLEKAKAKII